MRSLLAVAALMAIPGLSQSAPGPRFDAVSVRHATGRNVNPQTFALAPRRAGGRIQWTTFMGSLVQYAYNISYSDIADIDKLPPFGSSSLYEVEATFPENASDAQVRLMVLSMLQDRFHLKTHSERRTMGIYDLAVSRGGPKLKPADRPLDLKINGNPVSTGINLLADVNGAHLIGRGTLQDFARRVAEASERPVVDRTGIPGEYDFDVLFLPHNAAQNAPPAPPIEKAIESLGLHLESVKAPHQVLVIDSVESEPSQN